MNRPVLTRFEPRRSVGQTLRSIRAALGRRDTVSVIVASSTLYIVIYLSAIGHLFPGTGSLDLVLARDPVTRMFESTGTFMWEPIALVDLWIVRFLLAPLNLVIGGLLGVLVGLNVGLAVLAWRQPKACGLRTGSGFLAAVPALLSGGACCAPVLLVVFGIQASGILLLALDVALPIGIVLLLGSLVYVGHRGVDPVTTG